MSGYTDLPHKPTSEQLWLWPDEPWEGQAPRDLTAGRFGLFSRREPQKSMSDPADGAQLEFWPTGQKAPWKYQGAPLLKEV